MLAILFYVILAWILISLGVGVHASLVKGQSNDRAVAAAATTLLLPVKVVKSLFKK